MTSSHTPRLPIAAPYGIKSPVATATTDNIVLNGLQVINGYTLNNNDRVLVKNQTNLSENGIYVALEGDWVYAQDWKVGSQVANGVLIVDANTNNVYRSVYAGVMNVGETSVSFAPIATNDLVDIQEQINANTSDIAANTSDIAANTSDIAANTSDIAAILLNKRYVTPLDFLNSYNSNDDHTEALNNAIQNRDGYDVFIPPGYNFNVTKLTLRDRVSLISTPLSGGNIVHLPTTPTNLYTNGTVSVTKGDGLVTGSGTAFVSNMIGRAFTLGISDCIYVVADVIDANNIIVEPEIEVDTASGLPFAINDHYGMLEIPAGITQYANISNVVFTGTSANKCWFAYFRADNTGFSAGGYWKSAWENVTATNFTNGVWWRGTAGDDTISSGAFNNSLEPHQFLCFKNNTIAIINDGDKWRMTGQCNQFTGENNQFANFGNRPQKGVGVRLGRELLGKFVGLNSSKVPQGAELSITTVQFCEHAIKSEGCNGFNATGWYFEECRKGVTSDGFANSNRSLILLDNPQWRGNTGTPNEPDNYLVYSGSNSLVTVRDPHHVAGNLNLPAYKGENSNSLSMSGSFIIQGNVTGVPDGFTENVTPIVNISGDVLIAGSSKVVELSEFDAFSIIQSNLIAGETLSVFVTNPNGARVESGGNITLPHDRNQLRATRDTTLRFLRMDSGYILEEVYSPKNVAQRGTNFTLDAAYRNTIVNLSGSCTITIPEYASGEAAEDFDQGDQITLYITTANIVTVEAAAGVTMYANKTTTNVAGARIIIAKLDGDNRWVVNISD